MNERVALMRVVAEKHLRILTRYFVDTAGGLLLTYVMFLLVFFGGQSVAPQTVNNSLEGIIVGFFVWTMAFGSFQDPSQSLIEEAQWGTLEQLYMSPLPFTELLGYRTALNVLVNLLTGLVILLVMMITTGKWLTVDVLTVVPIVFFTLCTTVGLGFALGGIALVYKRVSSLFLIVQFLFVGAMATPSEPWMFNLLPVALGYDMLTVAMANDIPLWEFPVTDLVALVAIAAGYLIVGVFTFQKMIDIACDRGVFGHY